MKIQKGQIVVCLFVLCQLLSGCTRYTPPELMQKEESLEPSFLAEESQEEKILPIKDDSLSFSQSEEKKRQEPIKVKGIYVSAHVAGNRQMMEKIIEQIDRTELNAVVIDFKDDDGRVTAELDHPLFEELGVCKNIIQDLPGLIKILKEHEIYTIARVVSLRDPAVGKKCPQWCITKEDGTAVTDRDGMTWLNPYCEEVWEYLAETGRQAAKAGFDEVQFDYIRFATDAPMRRAAEKMGDGRAKTEIIVELARYLKDELEKEGVYVSVDVFGAIIGSSQDSEAVGQSYSGLASELDYICPMIYPSHYGDGNFGLDHPDMHPYATIKEALAGSREVLAEEQTEKKEGAEMPSGKKESVKKKKYGKVRPWLQDFTASWLKNHISYGEDEVRTQIQAVYDAGYEEWILWSAANRYHYGALELEK